LPPIYFHNPDIIANLKRFGIQDAVIFG